MTKQQITEQCATIAQLKMDKMEVENSIELIKKDIDIIKNNHLHHLEKDVRAIDGKVDRMDQRIWLLLIFLIGSILLPIIKTIIS